MILNTISLSAGKTSDIGVRSIEAQACTLDECGAGRRVPAPNARHLAGFPCEPQGMTLSGDEFLRLESLIYRPVSTRPDWLKAWRNEANYLLYLARRASDADDVELLEELEDQAREMADAVEARWQAEGL